MDFEDFYNLTPGQRIARRGTIASRPGSVDWQLSQLTDLCDYVRRNPWVVETLGLDVRASVQVSPDRSMLVLMFESLPD